MNEKQYHVGPPRRVEPLVGGRIYDSSEDGSESVWGQVTEWNPPSQLGFAWMITASWQPDADIEQASRVSVSFNPDGANTRVVLVHTDFWRLADGGQGMADAVGSPDGWGLTLSVCRVAPTLLSTERQ